MIPNLHCQLFSLDKKPSIRKLTTNQTNMNTDKSPNTEAATTKNYQTFADEMKRLCKIEKELFEQVLTLPTVFNQENSDGNSNKPKEYFVDNIKNIENELQKLEKMEVVIAFVGTMKAGKSTTINAIVGTEILPNRNAPMTTLPTLIRNKHGQTEPVLKLGKLHPLEELSRNIATKLDQYKKSNEISNIDLYNSNDGRELIEDLLNNKRYQFKETYQGQQEIFVFLKHLNDLMRLAKDNLINIEPPYHEYENLNDLPVIEIEFFHLKGKADAAQGSLAILDTPGPNEFGQSKALREIFQTQLKKASAVGLVIDYTQIKSDSETTVRDEVKSIQHPSNNNLYLLVNKFDQSNSNSMKKDELISYVVNEMMKGSKIESTKVYPISSQQAYLANRAKHNLEVYGKLPNPENEEWVVDFAKPLIESLGDEIINDTAIMTKRADGLWKSSYFNEPLDGIISEAHANAAEKSVRSALDKLKKWHEEISNKCEIVNKSIYADIKEINKAINCMEDNINEFSEIKTTIDYSTKNGLSELSIALDKLANENKNIIKSEIDVLFKYGKAKEEDSIQKSAQDREIEESKEYAKPGTPLDLFQRLIHGGSYEYRNKNITTENKRTIFDPNNPVITFDNIDNAKKLNSDIKKSVITIFDDLSAQFIHQSGLVVLKMTDEISKSINDISAQSIDKASIELKDNGFQLNLSVPKLKLEIGSFNDTDLLTTGMQSKTESVTKRRRKESVWGTMCSWVGTSDWGWEEYKSKKTSYQVDLNKIHQSILKQLENYQKNHTKQFNDYLIREFEPKIEDHINELIDYLARYRDSLLQSIETNQQSQEDKKKLSDELSLLMNKNKIQQSDINAVEKCLG